jgi:hypothetical protein
VAEVENRLGKPHIVEKTETGEEKAIGSVNWFDGKSRDDVFTMLPRTKFVFSHDFRPEQSKHLRKGLGVWAKTMISRCA